jgi:hypothetical protein
MVTHMKTTIDIADSLFEQARLVAKREEITMRALIEEGLAIALARHASSKTPFKLKQIKFGDGGFQPGFEGADWGKMRDTIYEDRGS